jgi:hypothetical protein
MEMNAKKRGRPSKRENPAAARSASYSLSPQHRFGLALAAKQMATDKTVVVQRGIEMILSSLGLSRPWSALYSDDELVTRLNVYALAEYAASEDERAERQFIHAHSRFFYRDAERLHPNAAAARVLWPKIGEYAKLWRENLHEDYHCAARRMAEDLKAAGLKSPPVEVDR